MRRSRGASIPSEIRGAFQPRLPRSCPPLFIRQSAHDRIAELSHIVRLYVSGGIAADLRQTRSVRDEYGYATRHRLERRQSEPFVNRWIDEQGSACVERGK